MPASHCGPLAGLPPALDLQSQRLEQGAARGALLDRVEQLIQAPASLAEQVTSLIEEGCTVLGRHCLQHEMAERFNVSSRSTGEEPQRRVTLMPRGR